MGVGGETKKNKPRELNVCMSTSSFNIKELIYPTLLYTLRHSFNGKESHFVFNYICPAQDRKEKLVYKKNIYPHNTYHMLFLKYTATFRSGVDER